MNKSTLSSLIWTVAALLRGNSKQSGYGRIILPFVVLHRLDCVLEPTKAVVLKGLTKKTAARVNSIGHGVSLHRELSFEDEICEHLAAHRWLYGSGAV